MPLRGVAEIAQCPRCGEKAPPQGGTLVTCAVQAVVRSDQAVAARRKRCRHTPEDLPFGVEWRADRLTLRLPNAGEAGLGIVGVGGFVLALALEGDLGKGAYAIAAFSIAIMLLGLHSIGDSIVRVDARAVSVRSQTLPFVRRGIARDRIKAIEAIDTGSGELAWMIALRTTDDRLHALHHGPDATLAASAVMMLREAEQSIPASGA